MLAGSSRVVGGLGCQDRCGPYPSFHDLLSAPALFYLPPEVQAFLVHMFTHTADRALIDVEVSKGANATVDLIGEIEQSSAVLATEDNDFLIRMGVSRKLLSDVMYKQKAIATQGEDRSTRRCLTPEELKRYNVVNL